jgi:hypothetical protein
VLDEESKRQVRELCDRIAKEPNGERFSLLVAELNRVFDIANIKADGENKDGGFASVAKVDDEALARGKRGTPTQAPDRRRKAPTY